MVRESRLVEKDMKMNWKSISLVAVIVGLLVAVTACAGYTLDDYIQTKTTPDIQDTVGVGPTVPLSEAPFVREQYVSNFVNNLEQYDKNVSDARFFGDLLGTVVNTGYDASEGFVKSLPMGEAAFALLGGLAGLFLRKPGTQKEIDAAWDEASAKAREAVLEGVAAIKKGGDA